MDEQAFLNAIASTPADDAPRLVYADWLDEHDQPERAEFIRRQVALARRHFWEDGYTSEAIACAARGHEHPEWLGCWHDAFHSYNESFAPDAPAMRRGFVNYVELPAATFLERADQLAACPVTRVNIKCNGGLPGPKKQWRAFANVREVDFSHVGSVDIARKMLALLDYWPHLTHFGLRAARVPPDEALELFQHPHTANVESLWIGGAPLPGHVEEHLTRRDMPNLRHLKRVWVPDVAWLQVERLRKLESLHILDSGNRLSLEEMGAIIPLLPGSRLHTLQLGEWNFTPQQCRRMALALHESQIAYLAFRHTRLAALQLADILTTQSLPALRGLALTGVDLDSDFAAALAASSVAPQLRVLWLNHVNAEVLTILANSASFTRVESLRLGVKMMAATDTEALRHLLNNPAWHRLRSLTLYAATDYENEQRNVGRFTPLVLRCLLASAAGAYLEELRLDLRDFNEECADLLIEAASWPALRLLTIRMVDPPHTTADLLQKHFGVRVRFQSSAAYM